MKFAIRVIMFTNILLMVGCTSNIKECEQRCEELRIGCQGNGYPEQICGSQKSSCVEQCR